MTDQPQPLDLDAIEARTDAASSGLWSTHLDWPGRVFSRNQFSGHIARCTGTRADENAAFIAAARTDVPALVAEIRRLTAELQQVQQQTAARIATEIRQYCPDHGEADTCRIDCHCEIADEITRLYTPHAHPCTATAAVSGA